MILKGAVKFKFLWWSAFVAPIVSQTELVWSPLLQQPTSATAQESLWHQHYGWKRKNEVQRCWEDHSQCAFLDTHSVLTGSSMRPGESLVGDYVVLRFKIQRRLVCALSSPMTWGVDKHSWRIVCHNALIAPSRLIWCFLVQMLSGASTSLLLLIL